MFVNYWVSYMSQLCIKVLFDIIYPLFVFYWHLWRYSSYETHLTDNNMSIHNMSYIISYVKFSEESISGKINAKSQHGQNPNRARLRFWVVFNRFLPIFALSKKNTTHFWQEWAKIQLTKVSKYNFGGFVSPVCQDLQF